MAECGYHDDLAGRLRGLVISLGDVLTSSESSEVEHFVDHAEFGEALRALAWLLVEEDKTVPFTAVLEIERLARLMGTTEELPKGLHAQVGGES